MTCKLSLATLAEAAKTAAIPDAGLKASVTAPATAGSLDISTAGLANTQWAILLTITNLTAASGTPRARITMEDTTDNFTTPLTIACWNIQGPITSDAPLSLSVERENIPSLRAGVTSAKLRCNLIALEGTTPTISYNANLLP